MPMYILNNPKKPEFLYLLGDELALQHLRVQLDKAISAGKAEIDERLEIPIAGIKKLETDDVTTRIAQVAKPSQTRDAIALLGFAICVILGIAIGTALGISMLGFIKSVFF